MTGLALSKMNPTDETSTSDRSFVASAERTIANEIRGLGALQKALGNGLGKPFSEAVALMRDLVGRVVVTGIGKSGHIGTKIAATLASTGTPSFFVHPSEASHGDLGMITRKDALLALSWSGETQELANMIAFSRRFRVPLIAITSRPNSALGRAADINLTLPKMAEACPHGLAPTTSTMLQLAMGDALAISLLEARGFTPQDFKIFHPGGRLGASLRFVRDIMHVGDQLPVSVLGTRMSEGIVLMTQKGFGCLGVIDEENHLVGIITDGDLRRHLSSDLLNKTVEQVMTKTPKTVRPDVLLASAMEMLESTSISALFVVEDNKPLGIVHIHDMLHAGVA